MTNIALFVPRQSMYEQALCAAETENIPLHRLKVVKTADTLAEAQQAVENGANIIVARGMQAQLIKLHTNFPLVEIKHTGQELGILVQKAKALSHSARPTIAFIGFDNLFSDMEHFEWLFNIRLLVYCVDHPDKVRLMVERAAENKADVIVGGDSALMEAQKLGMQGLFLESTEESIRVALRTAKTVGYARDMEKQGSAQLESIMDISYSGILKVDAHGLITTVNRLMSDILNKKESELLGCPIQQEVRGLQEEQVASILSGARERISLSVRLRGTLLMMMAAPIQYDGQITGAIFTFQKVKAAAGRQTNDKKPENYLHGHMAHCDFSQVLRADKGTRKNIEAAQLYALSKSPVVIYGEEGTEKDIFAEAIHKNSPRQFQPFVVFGCEEADEQTQFLRLFGAEETGCKGVLREANYGTLLLRSIDSLHTSCQYELCKILSQSALAYDGIENVLDVRIIATAELNLALSVEKGTFRRDLYFALGALSVPLAPLRETADEAGRLAEFYIREFADIYSRRVTLSEDARKVMRAYEWPGNIIQLKRFCERLVLDCGKHSIEEGFVRNLLENLYPRIEVEDNQYKIAVEKHPLSEKIVQLLEKYQGSRSQVAKELGISTTTLWRYMKKYNL